MYERGKVTTANHVGSNVPSTVEIPHLQAMLEGFGGLYPGRMCDRSHEFQAKRQRGICGVRHLTLYPDIL